MFGFGRRRGMLSLLSLIYIFGWEHRKRIKTEAKAKVVASVWGKEFIQFLAALTILY